MPVGNELRMGRIAIDKLIKADPVMITLSRPATNGVEDAEGGFQVGPPTPIAPQQFKKTMMKRRFSGEIETIEEGPIHTAQEILIGRYNVDVRRNDTFTLDRFHYRVRSVSADSARRSQVDRVIVELEVRGEE